MSHPRIGIIGTGHALPRSVRANDDPLFDWIRKNNPKGKELFTGYETRRYLAGDETIETYMALASRSALEGAGVEPGLVDQLHGNTSVAAYLAPNSLFATHQELGLRRDAWVIPVEDAYTNFLTGLVQATRAIETGQARYALVVCGCNWTQHVDYHDPVAIGIGDGAGAAVVGPVDHRSSFSLVDAMTEMRSDMYGVMRMEPRQVQPSEPAASYALYPPLYSRPLFYMSPEAQETFTKWGTRAPAELVLKLLSRHRVPSSEVTLITHQASSVLMQPWKKLIQPKGYLDTLARYGNMTLASIPVTLSSLYAQIETRYLVLLGLGLGIHATAVLLERP